MHCFYFTGIYLQRVFVKENQIVKANNRFLFIYLSVKSVRSWGETVSVALVLLWCLIGSRVSLIGLDKGAANVTTEQRS